MQLFIRTLDHNSTEDRAGRCMIYSVSSESGDFVPTTMEIVEAQAFQLSPEERAKLRTVAHCFRSCHWKCSDYLKPL